MKALSLWQPWAWLVVAGHKDIENRTWTTRFRGRIYIHAAKRKPPRYAQYWAIGGKDIPTDLPRGCIVGEVDIVDCIAYADAPSEYYRNPWFTGPYGLVLKNPVLYDTPIPYRGALGFFEVTLEGGNTQ